MENPDDSVTAETIVHHTRESPVRATTDSEGLNLAYQASESHILALMSRGECKQLLQIDCSWFLEKVSWSGGIPHDPEKSFYNIDSNDNCSCPYVNRCDGEK